MHLTLKIEATKPAAANFLQQQARFDRFIDVFNNECPPEALAMKKINFSQVFAGQAVGIKEVHDDIWLVSFMYYDLGYFDLETRVFEPLENPFGPKVLPMS